MLALAAIFPLMLSACGSEKEAAQDTKITKTITAPDGRVTIDVPENWSEDTSVTPESYLVLAIKNGDGAFSQIFYYPKDNSEYKIQDYTDMTAEDYYGENVIGEVQETRLNEHDLRFFEYSMVDKGVDGNEYNYHGYEYFIDFNGDVVEVDIFYSQDKLEGKLFTLSDEQLALLRSIAETIRVKE